MKKRNFKLLLGLMLAVISVCCFYACSGPKTYRLEFQANGGTMEQTVYEVTPGDSFTMPVPTRTGYEFKGWYLTADCTGDAVADTVTPDSDTTYYAEWEKLSKITLSVGAGSIEQTEYYIKPGENVYNFINKYVPTLEGHQFGAWYYENNELSKNFAMPEADITLVARYKVEYTIEVYKQDLSLENYEKSDDIKGYEYADQSLTPNPVIEGFKLVSHNDEVRTKTISENRAENIFKLYYDRNHIKITFNANYPDGITGNVTTREKTIVYGEELPAPYDTFALRGYCLVGWATDPDGEVIYNTDFLSSNIYQSDKESEPDNIDVGNDIELYAVWVRGYSDLFGGADYIFRFSSDPDAVYMLRDSVFFRGSYVSDRNTFRFEKDGEIFLSGKFIDDEKFAYSDGERSEYTATLFVNGQGFNDNIKIYFDEYNGISYDDDENGVSEGTYSFDESSMIYNVTFTSGPMSDQTMAIMRVVVRMADGTTKNGFMIRNEEEFGYGPLTRLFLRGMDLLGYNVFGLQMDGFGNILYDNGNSQVVNYYFDEGNGIYLMMNTERETMFRFRIFDLGGGRKGYFIYDKNFDGTYTDSEGSDATVMLDGTYTGKYDDGHGNVLEGYYSVTGSLFGSIVTIFNSTESKTFMVHNTEIPAEETDPEDSPSEPEIERTFELKPNGYAEYYYANEKGIYYSPYIVMNDTEENKASIYGYTSDGRNVLVATGSYEYDATYQRYTFIKEQDVEHEEVSTDPVDPCTIKTLCFGLGTRATRSGSFNVSYWYWMIPDGEEEPETKIDYTTIYKNDRNELLTIIGNYFVVYETEDDIILLGTYTTSNNITIITITVGQETSNLYVELNPATDEEGENTFIILEGIIGPAYSLNDGIPNENITLNFDGKKHESGASHAVYIVTTPVEDGDPQVQTINGYYYETTDTTVLGTPIYKFVGDDGTTFDFLLLTTSQYLYFALQSEKYNGIYTSPNGELLELDGYGYQAKFTDALNNVYTGNYVIEEEDLIYIILEEGYIYFNLTGDNTFTVRGSEYGDYLLMDNQELELYYFSFNGYGGMEVYMFNFDAETSDGDTLIDAAGTYEFDGARVTLKYKEGGKDVTLYGAIGILVINDNILYCILKEYEEVAYTYVNESDWSVLVLDAYGDAEKYTKTGVYETGNYTIVTENLLFYTNTEGTFACIYKYDTANGTATPIEYEPRGYFTEDLEALVFYTFGIMSVNGLTYYYDIEDDQVIIYRRYDEELDGDKETNTYGFIREEFGAFDDVKQYHDKTYYSNSGYSVLFTRQSGDESYPVSVRSQDGSVTKFILKQLSFAPSPTTTGEFDVNGVVTLGQSDADGGTSYDCVVSRIIEDGEAHLYITLQNFSFGISVNYKGDFDKANNNTYTVTSMRSSMLMYSMTYLTLAYLLGQLGIQVPNTYGIIQTVNVFTETGDIEEQFVNARFGATPQIYDTEGNLITAVDEAPLTINEDGSYMAEFTYTDNYKYRICFTPDSYLLPVMGVYGYKLIAFTREETVTSEDGNYKVTVERAIAADHSPNIGRFFLTLKLFEKSKETEEYVEKPTDYIFSGINDIYFIYRETDDTGLFTTAKYYHVVLKAQGAGSVEGSGKPGLALYENFTVEIKDVTTYYTSDKKVYVDISNADDPIQRKVMFIYYSDEEFYFPTNTIYRTQNKMYTAICSDARFTITIKDDGSVDIIKLAPGAESAD